MTDIRTTKRRLATLVGFANHLGLTPCIGANPGFEPRDEWSRICLNGEGNQLCGLYREGSIHLQRFLTRLTRELAHELAHYLVASPIQQTRKNYGIPRGKRDAKTKRKWDANEAKVFFVQHWLCGQIGFDPTRKDPLRRSGRFADLNLHRAEAKQWWKETGMEMVESEWQAYMEAE
jgi:hypothetical protein